MKEDTTPVPAATDATNVPTQATSRRSMLVKGGIAAAGVIGGVFLPPRIDSLHLAHIASAALGTPKGKEKEKDNKEKEPGEGFVLLGLGGAGLAAVSQGARASYGGQAASPGVP